MGKPFESFNSLAATKSPDLPLKMFREREKAAPEVLGHLRTAVELDENMANLIVKIDREFPLNISDKIFKKYSELVATTDKVGLFLKENFREQENVQRVSSQIKKSILQQANKLLIHSCEMLNRFNSIREANMAFAISYGNHYDPEREFNKTLEKEIVEFEQKIDQINVNTLLFLNSFKALRELGYNFSLEDVANSAIESNQGGTIAESDISTMRSIYSHNQKESAVHDSLLASFDKKVRDPKTRFSIFKRQDAVQSFVAFSDKGDSLYMSAFNVSPAARGYKIGETMLDQVVEQEAKENTLVADCDSKLPISSKYIETGWVATRYWDDHGDMILDIIRDDTERDQYVSKKLPKEEIVARHVPDKVIVKTASEQKDLPFELCNQGYTLTRMFFDQKMNQHYGVFEPTPPAHTESGISADASHK